MPEDNHFHPPPTPPPLPRSPRPPPAIELAVESALYSVTMSCDSAPDENDSVTKENALELKENDLASKESDLDSMENELDPMAHPLGPAVHALGLGATATRPADGDAERAGQALSLALPAGVRGRQAHGSALDTARMRQSHQDLSWY